MVPCHCVTIWLTPQAVRDRHIEALQSWRAWLGYLTLVVVLLMNQDQLDASALCTSAVQAPVVKFVIAFPCLPLPS
jgi:hypothetical protein